ncbi:MAG: hypothetical protein AAF805_13060 [Planctomycetota bacterium]
MVGRNALLGAAIGAAVWVLSPAILCVFFGRGFDNVFVVTLMLWLLIVTLPVGALAGVSLGAIAHWLNRP